MEDAAFAAIKIKELPLQGSFDLAASYSMGSGAEIFAKGHLVSQSEGSNQKPDRTE
jgi:hypothetical protein